MMLGPIPQISNLTVHKAQRGKVKGVEGRSDSGGVSDQVELAGEPPVRKFSRRALGGTAVRTLLSLVNYLGHTHSLASVTAYQMISKGEFPHTAPAIAALAPKHPKFAPTGERSNLRASPDVAIERPVVIVPGFHTRVSQLEPLVEKLGQGNGACYMYQGRFYSDPNLQDRLDHPPADVRVFVSVPRSGSDHPDQVAEHLDVNLRAIQAVTGSERVDAVGYSMGGLSCQRYLDRGGRGLGKLLMVGTPNQGSALAEVSVEAMGAHQEGADLRWLLSRDNLTGSDQKALEWLRPGSPIRNDMHARWGRQKTRLEASMIVGGATLPTLYWGAVPISFGDGIVDARSLRLEDTAVKLVGATRHGALLQDPKVYETMVDFFGWQAANQKSS